MKELWNKWRRHLHAKYVKDKPIQQALKNIPKGVDKKEWECLVKEHFSSESFQARSNRNAANRAKLKMLHDIGSKPIREIIYQKGGEKCCGPHTRSYVFGFGSGVKAKDLKGGTSSKVELLSALRSTREENKSLNKENNSLQDRLSTLEDEMKEMKKIRESFAAQQSHVSPTISPVSTE
ncbi:PREDICTED: uncharacterized protein LOC109205433 [Nicotiana attenuata]|uniref:Uncharacterized protein n=1 Tax=Nicotiana attenuata TaxID=49451 RepID=A0A314KX09_NICAT|nr:PREDICTED: uncharacterized protein LOC109205433 [Nicotiana attenuata]XP_019223689.1 PREDICTED: uncharacterized protein LOC109205433 [Nicotiana attenuata]XP_019223690.1 PREDICTED: uncharacterized protein LOC109205433 [Nicotiana attenuata]OIT33890.1 hypothetical protein A4A49_05102 [Nicotiana attenuata]